MNIKCFVLRLSVQSNYPAIELKMTNLSKETLETMNAVIFSTGITELMTIYELCMYM